jgi:hypothetical protein
MEVRTFKHFFENGEIKKTETVEYFEEMKKTMKIKKVKYDGNTVEIHQLFSDKKNAKAIVLSSKEIPTLEFIKTFYSLLPLVESLLELKPGYLTAFRDGVAEKKQEEFKAMGLFYGRQGVVTGVSFSYSGENDLMGSTITVQRSMENVAQSPLVINTPHLKEHDPDSGQDTPVLPTVMAAALHALIDQAERFVGGERGVIEEPEQQVKLQLVS